MMRKHVPSRGYDDAEREAVFMNGCAGLVKQGRDGAERNNDGRVINGAIRLDGGILQVC